MEELNKQVRRAGWLLGVQRFISALGWTCGIALCLALVPLVLRRIVVFEVADWVWVTGALGLGVLAAVAWAVLRSPGRLGAAMEVDRRFGLKERVSTALALEPAERDSQVGQTVVEDALRRIARIDVPDRFRVRAARPLLLPLLPAAVALFLVLLFDPAVAETVAEEPTTEPVAASAAELKNVKKSSELLRQEWAQRRKEAAEKDLAQAKELFDKLERGTARLLKEEPDREKALVELNKLAREVQKRREELGEVDKMRKHMENLKKVPQGPAKELAEALSRGDLNKASQALDKLKQQVAQSKLSPEDKQKLIDQLSEMQKQLKDKADKLADAHNAAKQDLQNRKKQAQGNPEESAKIQKQLDQLMSQLPKIDQLQDLASKLGQCSECLGQGRGDEAAKALGQLKDSLDSLQKQLDEMSMLDDAMNQIGQCRNQMCRGQGGQGNQPGMKKIGDGLGGGTGVGFRPDGEGDTAFRNSRVRPRAGEGSPIVVGTAPGPNSKGEAREKIREQFEEMARGDTDPLTGQRIPRRQREHAREYFDSYREGE